jgi:hypothetical protein
MASRNIFLPKESNRRIPNGTYGGVRGMNNLYSIGRLKAANHRNVLLADESKNIKPESARSWQLIAFGSTFSGPFPPTGILKWTSGLVS